MLIRFTVENFLSFKDREVFSLIPGRGTLKSHHKSKSIKGTSALKTAVVYGANASGKSNALMALTAIQYLVCSSGDLRDGKNIPCYEPYRLCSDTIDAPIKFGVEFIIDGTRYVYNISFKKNDWHVI